MTLVERLRLGGPNAAEVAGQAADMIEHLLELLREMHARLALDSEDDCRDVCKRLEIEDEDSLWPLAQAVDAALADAKSDA